jgi:hypothetical protein
VLPVITLLRPYRGEDHRQRAAARGVETDPRRGRNRPAAPRRSDVIKHGASSGRRGGTSAATGCLTFSGIPSHTAGWAAPWPGRFTRPGCGRSSPDRTGRRFRAQAPRHQPEASSACPLCQGPLPASRGPVPGPGGGLGNNGGDSLHPSERPRGPAPVQMEHKDPPVGRRGLAVITSHPVIVALAARACQCAPQARGPFTCIRSRV